MLFRPLTPRPSVSTPPGRPYLFTCRFDAMLVCPPYSVRADLQPLASTTMNFVDDAAPPLQLDTLAQAEFATNVEIGTTSVPVVSVDDFLVGGVVLHAGGLNQEDHRIRAISRNSLWLAGTGLEFPHTRREVVKMLAIIPQCPNNCSSMAACVAGTCACPRASAARTAASRPPRVRTTATIAASASPASAPATPVTPAAAARRSLSSARSTARATGFAARRASARASRDSQERTARRRGPACPGNCTGHGTCANSQCTCDFGYGGADCSVVTGGCPGNCTAHGECLRNGECLCEAGFAGRLRLRLVLRALLRTTARPRRVRLRRVPLRRRLRRAGMRLGICVVPAQLLRHGLCEAVLSPNGAFSFGCNCEIGFAGPACDVVRGGCPGNCTGHGACFNGTCHCDIGFTSSDCSLVVGSCEKNCSGHGRCLDGECDCHQGYSGSSCSFVGGLCPRNCSGHGACDERSATCVCDSGLRGQGLWDARRAVPARLLAARHVRGGLVPLSAGHAGAGASRMPQSLLDARPVVLAAAAHANTAGTARTAQPRMCRRSR